MEKVIFWIIILLFSTGCGLLEHRDFEAEMGFDAFNGPLFHPDKDFETIPGDNGRYYYDDPAIVKSRVPATEHEKELDSYQLSLKRELYSLENALSDEEFENYRQVSDKFNTDSERIYFLNLHESRRGEYLASRGISVSEIYNYKSMISRRPLYRRASGIENRWSDSSASETPVTLGMRKEEVASLLGSPERLEVAGNPQYENERWTYTKNGITRQIFFENGAVGGWTQKD